MPQSMKRDVDTAFEGAVHGSPHTPKRQRKRRRRTSENGPTEGKVNAEPGPTTATPANICHQKSSEIAASQSPLERTRKRKRFRTKGSVKELSPKSGKPHSLKGSREDKKNALVRTKTRTKRKTTQIEKAGLKRADVSTQGWSLSPGKGGVFIEQDPLLPEDGQHLILPTHSEVQVYATQTSLLVRSFHTGSKSDITNCTLSQADPKKLYVSNAKGALSVWDWTTGVRLGRSEIGRPVQQVLTLHSNGGNETILLLREEGEKRKSAAVYTVSTSTQKISEGRTILQRTGVQLSIKSYAQGSVLVACADDKLLVGQSQILQDGSLDPSYTWREITVLGSVTSFDAQVHSGKSKSSRKVPFLDVVIGLNTGVILQYEDILFKLIGKEKKNSAEDILARKLHWHRTGVNTVRWSRDRNYIISGGNETVLVIWQLDTNQRQYLPHLSTSILGLTVSATGSAYALRLGDNSIMVLSTADLLPSTSVNGLALGDGKHTSSSLVLHPKVASRLFAAVPANAVAPGLRRGKSSTLLQVYDLESNLELCRQALTRNMTTALNVGPAGQFVKEPNVTYIAISHDGKWLATVDEWQPNNQDLEAMYIDNDSGETRGAATETRLRLWIWNDDDNNWELVTRIDEPHEPGPCSILGLAANPAKVEVATIGSDSMIRIWSPKARHRNDIAVRNSSGGQLYTWTSSRTIPCDHNAVGGTKAATSAVIAYSNDGSVIAASWSWPGTPSRFVHLVDPANGKICVSHPDLLSNGDAKMAFQGRHLLCLSGNFTIVDTLTCQTTVSINLDPDFVAPESHSQSHLATNKYDGTVAISISRSERPRSTKLLILNLLGPELKVIFEISFPGLVKALLALTTGPGYLVIDEKNRFRQLRPAGAGRASLNGWTARKQDSDQVMRSLENIFDRASGYNNDDDDGGGAKGSLAAVEDALPSASPGGLDAALRILSSAQAPTPVELFRRVVGVLGGSRDDMN
ncbi:uncharacterized protein Z518_02401 [Rhinocladiella mackenziei CBS 650.93]|uniref:WD repeat protein n=1 Tax=Rhinocladiella mackenziei CBS 650.93 TaxID=1442369 RepID=A0A0D2FZL3_9EURO|nr:uncharacterized protein Z518_02401 [Rhinocladiella mackenziei CBS 650.93]KIX07747.1 hypothetical protein Z518_02401 [Rhinocladiella mackenziei CBS 650.93]